MCMQAHSKGPKPVPKKSTKKVEKQPDHGVRWMYVVDNVLWSLQLGNSKDELKSVLVGGLDAEGRGQSNEWRDADTWSKFKFEFAPASIVVLMTYLKLMNGMMVLGLICINVLNWACSLNLFHCCAMVRIYF